MGGGDAPAYAAVVELDLPVDVDERRRHRLIDIGVVVLSTALALAFLAVVVEESEPSRDEVVVQLVVGVSPRAGRSTGGAAGRRGPDVGDGRSVPCR